MSERWRCFTPISIRCAANRVSHVFARQAGQMVWDYAEPNPFSESSGNWTHNAKWTAKTVLEADGSPMSVRTALQIINQELDAYLTAQEGEMDPETRFCVAWFEQYSMRPAKFGEADVLARAKDTSAARA